MFAEPAREERFETLALAVGARPVFAEARLALGESDDGGGQDNLRLHLSPENNDAVHMGIELVGPDRQGPVRPLRGKSAHEKTVKHW